MKRQRRFYFWSVLCLAALFSRFALADAYDPPAGYYSAATATGPTLRNQLRTIITTGDTTRTYDDLRSDLQVTDADPNDPTKIRVVYNNGVTITKITAGTTGIPGWDSGVTWNREHSWPQNRGVDSTSTPDGSDMFHLFPAKNSDNSTRQDLNYGGAYGAQNRGIVSDGGSKYYPGDADAGMLARAEFYMDVRYDGSESNTVDLQLVAGNPDPAGTTMGDLTRLLEWHFAAPATTFERHRNQIIYDNYQHNRNPFIDHPEYVWPIFVNTANNSQISIAGSTVNADGSSTRNVDLGRVFVGASVPGAQAFTLNKSGNDGTYFSVTASGAATSSLSGTFNAMRTNQTDSKSITIGLNTNTSTAGLRSGSVVVDNNDITTGGGSGHGSGDQNDTFNVSLTVLDHSTPSFTSPAAANTLTLDFGNVALGSSPGPLTFNVYNLLATAANMDFDSITPSGSTSAFTTDLAASVGTMSFLAGGASHTFTSSLVASTVGTFSASYVLGFSDENITGALSKSITLNLTGTTRLAGDYNGDLVVDAGDYDVWRKTAGQSVTAYSGADGDGNGTINGLDFDVWRGHFGQMASGSGTGSGTSLASVPEPTGVALVAIALAIVSIAVPSRASRAAYCPAAR